MSTKRSTCELVETLNQQRSPFWFWRSAVAFACLAPASVAQAQETGDLRQGLAIAQRICAECHAVLPSEKESPRRELATFAIIANTPGMTGTALAVWLQTSHKSMPNFILELDERNNLIAYIVSLLEKSAK